MDSIISMIGSKRRKRKRTKRKKKFFFFNRVYCIHVPGHDPITFSFRSFSFLIGWGFYGPIR